MLKALVKQGLSNACKMACYLREVTQQPLEKFRRREVTPDWIAKVRDRMEEMRIDQADLWRLLLEIVKTTESAVSNLLAGKVGTSKLVAPVHTVLGWPKPATPEDSVDEDGPQEDPEKAAIDRAYEVMDEKGHKALAAMAKELASIYGRKE